TAGNNDYIIHPQMPAYYLRHQGIELRGVFLSEQPRQAGNFDGAHCIDLNGCLQRFDRVWLMTTAGGANPFSEMNPVQAQLLQDQFGIVRTDQYYRVRVLLLVRKGFEGLSDPA